MIPKLVLLVSLAFFWWLIKRDGAQREGLSKALWIPTLWVGIISSRPLSAWVGFGGATDTLEGSPIDRLFFFVMIAAALVVLVRRRVIWSSVIVSNWSIFLFYGFLFISVLWANSPLTSFKRWTKEIGNIFVLLVILTEVNPQEAMRAVFVRCGYVFIPLSYIFIRWFPDLGRRYNIHSGEMEAIGVTFQKNSLGAMVVVCGFMILWDWLEMAKRADLMNKLDRRLQHAVHAFALLVGGYLLYLSDSKTSIVCFAIGACYLLSARLPLVRRRISAIGVISLAVVLAFFALDQLFGIQEAVVQSLGRNMTFTGRTDVWRELLNLHTDPIIGTGFMSFWDDMHYRSQLPDWVAFSAHNGYLEVYLAGGYIGVGALAIMLLGTGLRINRSLAWGGDYAVVRVACYMMALVANFSESNFACMTPIGFLFLLTAIGNAQTQSVWEGAAVSKHQDAGEPDAVEPDAVEPRAAARI